MGKNKELTKLQKQIKKNFNKALNETAVQINTAIEYMYESAIQAFYESMEPKYYNRTYSTYYGSDLYDSSDIYDVEPIGNTYEVGITVSPKNIPGQPYYKVGQNRPDKNWVFERTYIKGIHGITPAERKAWGKNEYWDRKIRKTYKTSFERWLWMKTKLHWKFNQYTNIRFPAPGGIFHMPLDSNSIVGGRNYIMRPSPSDLVWREFSELRKPKNVERIFNQNLLYVLSK